MIVTEMLISSLAVLITLCYASYLDIKDRRVPFRTWYPMLLVGLPAAAYFYITIGLSGRWELVAGYIALCIIFSLMFYLFAVKNLFGGADAWALIFISTCIPFFPISPYFGYPPMGFLPFSVLTNAVLLNLFAPAGIFVMNVARGNRAPLPYMFFGFPVDGKIIQNTFGFVMEDFEETGGSLTRRFVGIRDSLRRQITQPVLWQRSVERMIREGVQVFYEVGPGRVLTGLIRKIDRKIPVVNVSGRDSIAGALATATTA